MRHAVLAVILAALLPPLEAAAAPAVVRLFEAPARSEPRADAPVLHTFAEGAAVSVSEEATDGWRRVRLPDGATGWVEERAISLAPDAPPPVAAPAVVPAPVAPAPVLAAPARPPDLRAHIYVKDVGHLAELVRGDPTVSPMAEHLLARRRAAWTFGGIGIGISTAFMVYGMSQSGKNDPEPGDPDFMKTTGPEKAFVGGVIGSIVSTAVLLALLPRNGELLDLINTWNVAHPDKPFTIERGMVGQGR